MNEREITIDDILQMQAESEEVTLESLPVARAPQGADPNQKGAWSFVKTAAKQDWAPYAVARLAADSQINLDDEFDIADMDEREWDDVTNGLDEDVKERLAGAARSKSHLYWLADNARESAANEAELASYGGWGVAGRVAVGIIDPTNIALAVGTGGVGVAAKAERIKKAITVASSLGERRAAVTALGQLAPEAGKLSSAVKVGLQSGVEAAALETVLVAGSPERDNWDVAYAGIGGLVLGTGIGKLMSGNEANMVRRSHNALKAKLENDELLDGIARRRSEITAAIGNVEQTRAQLGEAIGGASKYLSERDTDLGTYGQFRRILESGGRADAKSPTSSATGIDQFTEGTWLGMVSKEKPDWAKGLTKEQVLELRKDPQKSSEMVAALDRDSTNALRKAGAPVNHFTLYAMHHFGELKGKRFALAADDVLMDDILSPAQLKANAYLKGKTKAEAIANWAGRAKKGGWDLGGAVDVAGVSKAELRAQDAVNGFDRGTAEARLTEIDDILKKQEGLRKDAEGALKQGELRKLSRDADDLRAELKGARKSKSGIAADGVAAVQRQIDDLRASRKGQLEALHAEDVAKMGEEIANTKARAKLREGVVDKRIADQEKNLQRLLGKAKDTHGRARYAAKTRLGEVEPRLQANEKASLAGAELKRIESLNKGGALEAEGKKLREALGLNDQAKKDVAAAGVRRTETSGHLKALSGKAADLDKLDALDNLQSAADLRTAELEARGFAEGFGEDTLSAARVVGFDAGLHPALEGTAGNAPVGRMKLANAVKMFGHGTFAGVLRGSDNEIVRQELGVLVGNSLGEVGDTVNTIGASEIANHIQKTFVGKWSAAINPAYADWMKERGISKFYAYSRGTREQFMRAVGLAVRGQDIDSPAVKAAAAATRKAFADFLTEAKAAGVKGFENVQTNGSYLPRVFDFHRLHQLIEKHGPDEIGRLFKEGIKAIRPELDDKIAAKVANAYVTRMRELRVGSDAGMMQGMSFDDVGFLRQFLGDAKLGSDEIEEIVAAFAAVKRPSKTATKALASEARKLRNKQKVFRERIKTRASLGKGSPKAQKRMTEIQARLDEIAGEIEAARSAPDAKTALNQEGNFRHAKMRQKFDENFALDLRLKDANDGSAERVTISDLFENNVESLMGRYSRAMSGHIGLAKVGIKSRADFSNRLKRVERALENDPTQLKNVKRMAEAAHQLLTATPLENSSLWTELGRTGRDIAYAAQMENVGISNIPDLASLLAWGNFKYTAKTFFGGDVFGAMWKRDATGRLINAEWREIEETFGSGTDFLSNQVFSSYDIAEEYAQELAGAGGIANRVSSGFAKVGHAARVTSRAVTAGSGLAAITSAAQRLAARNVIYRIKDDVLRGGGFSKARAASLGLGDAMKDRIAKQFKKHTGKLKGEFGDEVETSNFHLWDDQDARDAFLYAVHRETKKNVQEEDLGDTLIWMHSNVGKIVTQFRRFGLTAWTKQTLRGIAERDAETATRALIQFTMASTLR